MLPTFCSRTVLYSVCTSHFACTVGAVYHVFLIWNSSLGCAATIAICESDSAVYPTACRYFTFASSSILSSLGLSPEVTDYCNPPFTLVNMRSRKVCIPCTWHAAISLIRASFAGGPTQKCVTHYTRFVCPYDHETTRFKCIQSSPSRVFNPFVVAQCSLLEFLVSTAMGLNVRPWVVSEPDLQRCTASVPCMY